MAKKEEVDRLIAELRTVDAKIEVVAQRIRTIEKNEEVIGRTLLSLSQKVKKLEAEGVGGAGGKAVASEELEKKYATKSELAELRYILDAVNPLEYATISQVRELLEEKLGALKAAQQGGQEQPKEKPRAGTRFMERF